MSEDISTYESQDPEFFNKRGMERYKAKDIDSAYDDFSKAINLSLAITDPDAEKLRCRGAYYFNRAYVDTAKKDYQNAYDDMSAAIAITDAKRSTRLSARGNTLRSLGRYEESIADYSAALSASVAAKESDPVQANMMFGRAKSKCMAGHKTEAIVDAILAICMTVTHAEHTAIKHRWEAWCEENGLELKSLTFMNLPDGLENMNTIGFYGDNIVFARIPGTLYYIPKQAFGFCGKLKYALIENGVGVVGEAAFMNSAIEHIVIPPSVKILESCAFFCPKSKVITIGAKVKMKKDSFCDNFQWDYKYQKQKAGTYVWSQEGQTTPEGDTIQWVLQDEETASKLNKQWTDEAMACIKV
jgi:tetratricopeptide (TPR) repeat protein